MIVSCGIDLDPVSYLFLAPTSELCTGRVDPPVKICVTSGRSGWKFGGSGRVTENELSWTSLTYLHTKNELFRSIRFLQVIELQTDNAMQPNAYRATFAVKVKVKVNVDLYSALS